MSEAFSKACTEVLTLLSFLDDDELSKIPLEKIEFLKRNQAKDYDYILNLEIPSNKQKISSETDITLEIAPLERQNISPEANAIFITLYRDYFANEEQKKILEEILECNDEIIEKEKELEKIQDLASIHETEHIIETLKQTNERRLQLMFSLSDENI